MTYDHSVLFSCSELPPVAIEIDNEATAQVTGKDNITVELKVNYKRHLFILKDVLHILYLGFQLFYVPTMDKLELENSFKHGRCYIKFD
eukprot:IDg17286t1